jgi:aspartate aminotransferase
VQLGSASVVEYDPSEIAGSLALNSRLAHRIQRIRPSATVAITALAAELRAAGRDVIGLSVGEPDFDTPEHIKQAAIEAIRRGDTKYTAVDGTPALKAAIAAKFRRENGLAYDTAQIVVSNGAKQCCYNVCQAILGPGDEAIIPAPYWVSFPDMVRLAEGEPVIVHASSKNGFKMTPEELTAAITPRTKLLILNSPCNPTGAVYSRDELEALGAVLIEQRHVMILADDIYEHIHWNESPLASMAAACPALEERTITVNGVSKSYAMTGWRIGYAAGPGWLMKAMLTLQGQCTTNPCSISQAAAVAALEGDQTSRETMRRAFAERHAFVLERLAAMAGLHCVPGKGAFYAFPSVSEAIKAKGLTDDTQFCQALLEDAGVALVPGTAFGAPGHVRLSFACGLDILAEALDRIERFVTTSARS